MSSTGISFGGLSSGLDTKAIIQQLVAIERRPIDKLMKRKTLLGRQKALLSDFETKLKALKTAADDLRGTDKFLEFKTSLDETGFFTATATGTASKGTYTIKVNALATAKQSASNGYADKDTTTFGTGDLNLTVNGVTKTIAIDSGNDTLQGIADAINAGDAGVNATVINTGSGATPYKLVLTGKNTGTVNAFTLTTTGGDGGLVPLVGELNTAGAANQIVAAASASFTVNGLQLTRQGNTVTDAIPGVTLTLTGVHPAATNPDSVLTVSTDSTLVGEKVKKLVDAYNAVVTFVKDQSTVDSTGKSSSPLFGDSTLRSVRTVLRDVVGQSVDTGSTAFALLGQVGVTGDRDGLLTFNVDKFKTALETDEAAVQNLFTKTGVGIAQVLFTKTDALTNTADGVFAARRKGFDSKGADIDRQVRLGETRISDFQLRLTMKYAAMETAVGRLKAMGQSLGINF